MLVSQKCQYAIRAIFELSRRWEQHPVKIADIAEAQSIPPRFLEVILSQLKQGGFIESKRGSDGGYTLARHPMTVTVGEVIRFLQGPIGPIECVAGQVESKCSLRNTCVFMPMWEEAKQALANVFDQTTFQCLLDREKRMNERYVPTYAI